MNKVLNKKTGIGASIAAVAVIGAVVFSTTFSSAMTLDEAKDIAKKYVPQTAEFVTSEDEDNKYEVMFHDNKNKESFEVEVLKETKQVKKVESQLDNDGGSKTVKLTEADVEKLIKKNFDGVSSVTVMLAKDDGLYEYEATFKADDFYGNADIHPENGAILESKVKFGTAVTIPNESKDKEKAESGLITAEEAKKAAIKEAGGGTVKDIDLDKEKGNYYYEIELVKDGMEYEFYVDAVTGEVALENEHDSYLDYDDESEEEILNKSEQKVSIEDAKQIVLAKIPGATIKNISLDSDDGISVYEGEATLEGYEYDFEINASSGVIIEWEKERIELDEHDD